MVYYVVETLVWFGVRVLVVVGLVLGLPLGLHYGSANVVLCLRVRVVILFDVSCFKRSVLVVEQGIRTNQC